MLQIEGEKKRGNGLDRWLDPAAACSGHRWLHAVVLLLLLPQVIRAARNRKKKKKTTAKKKGVKRGNFVFIEILS